MSSTLCSYAADLAASLDQEDETPRSVLAVTGLDVTSQGSIFSYGGALIAPSGDLDKSGLRIWIFGEAGTYKYDSVSDVAVRGRSQPRPPGRLRIRRQQLLDQSSDRGQRDKSYAVRLRNVSMTLKHLVSLD
jgi:hypothetical protein